MRLRELAGSRARFGYRRLTILLKREEWPVKAKRIYQLYTEEGLTVRTRNARRQPAAIGHATKPNEPWSMDFVSDRPVNYQWFRVLTVVDQFTRECLLLYADSALSGEKVDSELERIVTERGVATSITVDRSPKRVGCLRPEIGANGSRKAKSSAFVWYSFVGRVRTPER
jgi:putative transposase